MLRLFAIVLAVLLLAPTNAHPDSEMAPYPHVTSSESGRYYFRMEPDTKQKPAAGTMYRLRHDGEDEALWSTSGWYAYTVFVPRGGAHVVRIGNWPRGLAPKKEDLAVAFYHRGKLVRAYSTLDLIEDSDAVRPSVSHYQFQDWNDPPRLMALHVGGSHRYVFRLRTIDGITYLFDPTTGEIVNQSPSGKDLVGKAATAEAIARAVLLERFGRAALEPITLAARRQRDEWIVVGTPGDEKTARYEVVLQARDGTLHRIEESEGSPKPPK